MVTDVVAGVTWAVHVRGEEVAWFDTREVADDYLSSVQCDNCRRSAEADDGCCAVALRPAPLAEVPRLRRVATAPIGATALLQRARERARDEFSPPWVVIAAVLLLAAVAGAVVSLATGPHR